MSGSTKDNRTVWRLFALFALLLFLKCVLFHWVVLDSLAVRSLWRDTLGFYGFYMAKLLVPLFIASFVFIIKGNWWTILVSGVVDLWLIANAIYYKAYDSFLTFDDILLVDNMAGLWSSVNAYLDGSLAVYLLMTAAWGAVIARFKRRGNRHWSVFVSVQAVLFLLACLNNCLKAIHYSDDEFNRGMSEQKMEWDRLNGKPCGNIRREWDPRSCLPFHDLTCRVTPKMFSPLPSLTVTYVRQQSILLDFFAILFYQTFLKGSRGVIIDLEEEDIQKVSRFVSKNVKHSDPTGNLVIILVESLESWPIDDDIEGQCVASHLRGLTKRDHVLYCNRVRSQTLEGCSGDGQMTINTGLLPILAGVACIDYCGNVFPNVAGRFASSSIVNPIPKVWNQDTMSVRYGYTKLFEPTDEAWADGDVLRVSLRQLRKSSQPSCLMAITSSMHSPFTRVTNDRFSTRAPLILNGYLRCLNYTDACIGAFMKEVLDDPILSQSTIVITGDHTVFKPTVLTEFKDYAVSEKLSIASGETFCPLIIYSPAIEGNVRVTDLCYQMDIYPTVKHLIGCASDGWQGLGVNLLDPAARRNRPIDEQEAYRLSDLMIRSDYFRRYLRQRHPGGKPDTEEELR